MSLNINKNNAALSVGLGAVQPSLVITQVFPMHGPGRQPFGCLVNSKQLAHNVPTRIKLAIGNVILHILEVLALSKKGLFERIGGAYPKRY